MVNELFARAKPMKRVTFTEASERFGMITIINCFFNQFDRWL